MRIAVILCALATVTVAAPKKANVKLPESLQRAERKYRLQVGKIEAELTVERKKASEELIDSYRTALKAASSNGQFDQAKFYIERIKQLESQFAISKKPVSARGITILSATWGVNQSWRDVTDTVAKSANNKTSWSYVPNEKDLGNHAPGFGKTLVVRYSIRGHVKIRATYTGRTLSIP